MGRSFAYSILKSRCRSKSEKPTFIARACSAIIQYIPINKIGFFKDHPFRLYDGERLTDMANSIESNGVLVPVIVRKIETDVNGCDFEMLAGHNRMNAAQLIGLEQLPYKGKSHR
ncbi:ParB N-terminal domain-containing protein [Paenibacillus sp. MSJ-34]|uniref:ParB N-terminal domain-containing protein n=1 Tax=Paenibacillus sp. MSJ-34 TaxID=2841529 RepID=UPI001C11C071|nr:ParB N-terminal domain-containing protein [Paenibacillus sp. MSJ-34]